MRMRDRHPMVLFSSEMVDIFLCKVGLLSSNSFHLMNIVAPQTLFCVCKNLHFTILPKLNVVILFGWSMLKIPSIIVILPRRKGKLE